MPPFTLDELLPRLGDYITKWAREIPGQVALHQYHLGGTNLPAPLTYKEFDEQSDIVARNLLAIGLKKGDVIVTSHMMTIEWNILSVACFKIGVVVATLDLRYKNKEIVQLCEIIKPKAFFFIGVSGDKNIASIITTARSSLEPIIPVSMWFQSGGEMLEGVNRHARLLGTPAVSSEDLQKARGTVTREDPALIIFTTGTTGTPKPALLSHDNILVQNVHLANWNKDEPLVGHDSLMLCNLPNSHVGGATEQLWTTLFAGGTVVLIPMFDARVTLEAIQRYKVTHFGQIPAMFKLEFMLPDFKEFNLTSLKFAIYAGASVSPGFLREIQQVAPQVATGMGLTETAGFTTYSPPEGDPQELVTHVGAPAAGYLMTIRAPMLQDGSAGPEKPRGEIGEICYKGRQTFKGYLGMPEETKKVISSDGWLYSGDLGYITKAGFLGLSGRSKFMIKTKGYNVFPTEVENALKEHPKIKDAAVVGRPHNIFSEAIIAFVVPEYPLKAKDITQQDIDEACKDLAGYKKPAEFIPLTFLPLNRVNKTDYQALIEKADKKIEVWRKSDQYDAGKGI